MDLNTRVEKIMEYAELTPSEFANKIGVNPSNISQIINRRNKPSLDLLTKIKTQFSEIEWEWLIEGKGELARKENLFPTLSSEIVGSKFNSEFEDFEPSQNLFNLSEEDNYKPNFLNIEEFSDSSKNEENPNPRESDIPIQDKGEEKINDSQKLGNKDFSHTYKNTEIQEVKIKKIVFFYENGKFEAFEP